MKEFSVTKFVTVNVVKDWINNLKDVLGLEQTSYEEVVSNKTQEIFKELNSKGKIKWFRQTVDRTFEKTIQITIYGQYEE
jgi:hypothetical protein